MRNIKFFVVVLLFSFLCVNTVFAASEAEKFLFEYGRRFYDDGDYAQAIHEFHKVLILNPEHPDALNYIKLAKEKIDTAELSVASVSAVAAEPIDSAAREKAIANTLQRIEKMQVAKSVEPAAAEPPLSPTPPAAVTQEKSQPATLQPSETAREKPTTVMPEKSGQPAASLPVTVTGDVQVSLGFTSDDTLWKRANADLNERNWRIMSDKALNQYENTYDPGIFDRLRVNVDTEKTSGLNFHTNVTVDPWSFTGKSDKISLRSADGLDSAEFQVLYWSNYNYTVDHTIYTQRLGDSFSLPEMRVIGGRILPLSIGTNFGGTFNIPELKIHKEFWPIREFWFDYKNSDENLGVRFFPMAYQDQAYSSDDPLALSNHHIWWEESPWLSRWQAGHLNAGSIPGPAFSKGQWDDSLAFFTRDSDGTRLTALRGFSFDFSPSVETSLIGTFASPKELWQDYESFDTFPGALRLKHLVSDNFDIGGLYTYRYGLHKNEIDASNHVAAVDSNVQPMDGVKMSFEVASSQSAQDKTSAYTTHERGSAYFFSIVANPGNQDMLEKNYYDLRPKKGEGAFMKSRFFFAHMDDGFDPGLSNYRETRDDTFWSRHIHFRKPFEYYYTGLYYPATNWDDIEPFRLGDSVDTGRDVVGLRAETSFFDSRLQGLGDIRNAHNVNGKYIETISRTEWTYQVTPQLTTKLFLLNQDMPKTTAGIDPFLFDPDLNIYLNNSDIPGGADPSLNTGSLGAEYRFNDVVAVNGVYERTNDSTVATDNFGRGAFNASTFTSYMEDGMLFWRNSPFLYDQADFPLPPYNYFDIFRLGLQVNPTKAWEIYLDGARNEYKSAGSIDDNINHVGIEVAYTPTEKLGAIFKYRCSFWNDIVRMNQHQDKIYQQYNNFYGALRYRLTQDDMFMLEYGVGGYTPIGYATTDPFGGSSLVLDTQHILRAYYNRKF